MRILMATLLCWMCLGGTAVAQTPIPGTEALPSDQQTEDYPPTPVMENGRRILPSGLEVIPAKPLYPDVPVKPVDVISPDVPAVETPDVAIPTVKTPAKPNVEPPKAVAEPSSVVPRVPSVPQAPAGQAQTAEEGMEDPPKPVSVPFSTVTRSPSPPLVGRPPGYTPKIDAMTGAEINKPPGAAPLITPVHDAITGKQLNADPKSKPYQSPVVDAITGQQLNAAQNEKNGYAPYVPLKRDAITNRTVDTLVGSNPAPQKEEKPSLRDRVRSKLKEDR